MKFALGENSLYKLLGWLSPYNSLTYANFASHNAATLCIVPSKTGGIINLVIWARVHNTGLSQAIFGRSVNPITTRGKHYPHPALCAIPGFSDLATALWKKLNSHSGFLNYLQDRTANPANLAAIFCPALVCSQKATVTIQFLPYFWNPLIK